MHSPSRPGDMIKRMLEEMNVSVTAAAQHLGVSRQTLNHLINHKNSSVSPEMAVRLETVIGSSADNWLRMQAAYDAAEVAKRRAEISQGLQRLHPAS